VSRRTTNRGATSQKTATSPARASGSRPRTPPKRRPTKGAAPTRATQVSPEEEAAFLEALIQSGQAVPVDSDGKLPAGATHKIVEDETGKLKVVRRRFSIT
jgi:hypothetical protein